MTRYGYFLSCEEYEPAELVRQARLAEQAGFDGLWISDHFHPWLDEQGQASFVWTVIGAIAQATSLPITGGPWPAAEDRMDMLAEAVGLIRELLSGGSSPITAATTRWTPPGSPRCRTARRRSTCQDSARSPSSWRPGSATATCPSSPMRTWSGSIANPAAATGRCRAG